ncbi:MAG: two-component system, chemotaxis family, sensor kinase CheA [Acidobacteriota bacterium]|nr:two-component system, chemotaxis family, sensor kinase CheA [Acidobacteriota bacterium]
MDAEFADLIPLFVEEARDRLERLASSVPRLETDPPSVVEAKRELHTLKGAGRMMRIGALAELCHAAEEVLLAARPGMIPLLTRVVDELTVLVEAASKGSEPPVDPELVELLRANAAEAETPEAPAAEVPPPAHRTDPTDPTDRSDPPPPPAQETPPPAPAAPSPSPAAPKTGSVSGDVRVDTGALDAVAERATQVRIMAIAGRQVVDRIYDLARLAEEGLHEPQPTQVLAVLATMLRRVAVELEGGQRRLIRSAEEQLEQMLSLQLQPMRGFLLSFARYARELARAVKKEVEVELEGEETRLDRRIARELEEALLHLVRNAVDHGIEPPEVRQALGKPRSGHIRIQALADGPKVRLVIADDGGGIDVARVIQKAVEVGLVDATSAAGMGKKEALRLLFSPGFSTRKQVSEISGRGVGLDVVANVVNRVGGEVFVETEARRGTTFSVEVPVARRGESVMLLRVGELKIALPASVVRRATRLDANGGANGGGVVERDGRTLAVLPDRLVPFVPLSRIYGQPAAERQLLLEGIVSGQPLALAVDDVEGEHEVLVRPITRRVPTDHLLEGVALLASGEPVGVLSPAVLAQAEYLRALPAARPLAVVRRVRVLLVDDSLVTREMERRLLEDAGFLVTAAADAEEALSRLAEEKFDCVVTDIEMPRMDGFELAAQLRGMEHFAQLPIIVVSTRDRPEDRLRGLKVGADAYLTKQSLDAGELVDLVRRLSGK